MILSFIDFSKSNGRPVDVKNAQGFRSEETSSAHLRRAVCQGQPALRQRGKL